jgi:hypothetical protein
MGLVDSTSDGSISGSTMVGDNPPVAERLSTLADFQARWRSFNPAHQSTHKFPGIPVERFVYNEGVLTVEYYDENLDFQLWFLLCNTSTMLEWSYPMVNEFGVNLDVINFQTDPAKDLLIVLECVLQPLRPCARCSTPFFVMS